MTSPDLRYIENASSLIALVNTLLVEPRVRSLNFNLALCGGASPAVIYDSWRKDFLPDIKRLRIFWVDERYVPHTCSRSNFGACWSSWPPSKNVQLFPVPFLGIENIEASVRSYAGTIRAHVPTRDGMPTFDAVLLGLGVDGHIASLFPGIQLHTEAFPWIGWTSSPEKSEFRISMTRECLGAARLRILLAIGENKRNALRRLLVSRPASWAASYLLEIPNTILITDLTSLPPAT